MDMKTLITGLKVLGVMVLVLVGFYATLLIGGLVVGTISNTATSGDIEVSSAMNTSLTGIESDYISQSDNVSNNIPLIVGLVAVVVIVLIFFGRKFNLGGTGGSSGGMN